MNNFMLDPAKVLTREEIKEAIVDYVYLHREATEEELDQAIREAAVDKALDDLVERGFIRIVKDRGELRLYPTDKGKNYFAGTLK